MHYIISKLINNNVVFSVNAEGDEIILFGKGIGFSKKSGDSIESDDVIKVFGKIDSKEKNYLLNLVEDIDPLYIDIASQIIQRYETELGVTVNDLMVISLSDHISNAVANKKDGFDLPLDIIQNVKSIYHKEFIIAKSGLEIIKKETNVALAEDEAGYIVLHYINSQGTQFRSDAKYRLRFQERIINNIESYYKVELDRSSLYYTRFLTHLSFLAARIHDGEFLKENNSDLYRMIIEKNRNIEKCIDVCSNTIYEEFEVKINDEEKAYLAIHINNMLKSIRKVD